MDAEELGIVHGDQIVLDLPHGHLELKARVSDQMAPGVLVIQRRHDMFWQQFNAQGRLFINKPSIHIKKKE